MEIVSPSPVLIVILLFVIGGLVAALTPGLRLWQRVLAILVTLFVPLIGGLIVVVYVAATWSSRRAT